jgi:hypothetical protein
MSTIAEQLRKAKAEGNLDTFRIQENPELDIQPAPPVDTNPDYLPPEVLESVTIAEDEISTGQYILGTAVSTAGELGTGLYGTHKLHQSQKYLRWANNAKKLSTLGIVTPEPSSTVAGVVGLTATEGGIWLASNFIGQSIRKAYGIQDSYSAGESIASTVFGIGLVTKAADKVFRLSAPSLASAKAWKGKELVVNGTKTFVSGAALGLAESALRQEVEAHLNGTDRNVYDYMFSSAAGGSFNTIFSVWARTGKWGRNKATDVIANAKENLEAKKAELQQQIKDAEEPLAPEVAYGFGGAAATAAKSSSKHQALQQIKDIEQSQAILDDSIAEMMEANKVLSKQEVEPTVKEEPDVEVEDVTKELEESEPIVVRDEEPEVEEVVEVKEEAEVEEPTVEKEAPVVEAPKRERNVDDAREDTLDDLIERIKNIDTTPESGTLSIEAPRINREGKQIADANIQRMNDLIRAFVKNPSDKNIAQAMLNEIKFSRSFNRNVTDWLNTTGGRLVQSQRGDAKDFAWATKYSIRAQLQDEALARLQATLEAKTRGVVDGDEADIQGMFNEYLAIPEELKKRRKPKPTEVKEDDEIQEVFKESKVEEDEDIQEFLEDFDLEEEVDVAVPEEEVDVKVVLKARKPTKKRKKRKPAERLSAAQKAEKALQKRKKKLQERLKELQGRFGDPSKLTKEQKKQLQEDPEIADLKQRIKFYDASEKDFIEVKRLEAELAKVSELDVAPLGEQRAAVTPKPKAPTKPTTKATELKAKISKVKANIKQRLADIDKARREMDEEFSPEKAEQAFQKKITTLQTELDELRATFGKEPEELVPTAPKEKDPRVKDLEDKIKFYKDAQSEVRRIKELEAERARLLEIETGPLGRQRAEVEAKPTAQKKAPGRVQELTKDIADLRKNMRNRVQEIDRARVEMSDEFKAEQLRKAYENKRDKLQKELDGLRSRFAKIDEQEKAAGLKPSKKKDPRLKELEEKVKYYKEAEIEARAVVKLEQELARVADIEGRAVVGELRKEAAPTPKGATKAARSKELRKKIADSKKRMRQKLSDLDRARKEIEEERLNVKAFKELEESFYKALEKDTASWLSKGWGYVKMARQLSLIDQLPSVLAGLPTGVGAVVKQFYRPLTNFMYNAHNVALPVRKRLAMADAAGAFKILSDTKGLWAEMRRTFAENVSAVDSRAGRMSDEINPTSLKRGEHSLVSRAYKSAERRVQALENTSNWFTNAIKNGQFGQLWTLGVRGIQTLDSVFKRQLIKGRLHAEAHKKAILEFPNDPAKAQKRALELYDGAWRDSDGLAVLNDAHEFEDTVNQIREELLFAADGDLEDMPINGAEKIIRGIKKLTNDNGALSAFIDAFLPYVGVPIRAVYRGARFSLSPALAAGSVTPGVRRFANPFSGKIKELDIKLKEQYSRLRKIDDPKLQSDINEEIKDLTRRKNQAEERRLRYNEDILTDAMLSTSLYAIGGAAAFNGMATGSLEWLTVDQRQKNKLQSFNIMGSDYSAALPWSFPIAMAADVMSWYKIKKEERDTGQTILTKDQTLDFVLGQSFKKLAEAMPLAQGVETAQEIAKFEGDVTRNALSRLVASYVPIPAQARKIIQTVLQDGVPDLRGQGYWDRIAYSVLGAGAVNLKTNLLGEDLESTHTWVTQTVIRQAPRKKLDMTRFEEIVASDTHGNIQGKDAMIADRLKMVDFVDDDGMTLSYAFDQRLKRQLVKIKKIEGIKGLAGKRMNINQAVNSLITNANWIKKYNKGFQITEKGKYANEGLVALNSLLNQFYNQTKKDILEDKTFLASFINEDEDTLYSILETRGTVKAPEVPPAAPFEILQR